MQLFLFFVLWHSGGQGLFWDQGRSRPHSPRSEKEQRDWARRSLNWCRWRWSSFAAPRLCTGNAGRGGDTTHRKTSSPCPLLSHPKMTSLWLHYYTPSIKSMRWEEERVIGPQWQQFWQEWWGLLHLHISGTEARQNKKRTFLWLCFKIKPLYPQVLKELTAPEVGVWWCGQHECQKCRGEDIY